MKETNLQIINRRIKSLECLVTADASNEETPLLKQLRNLREEIKTKAQLDYVDVQNKVLVSFRVLMNQLTTLSYYAAEADKNTKLIEKVISSLNKLKSLIAEDLLKEEKKEDETGEVTTSEAKQVPTDEDLKTFVLRHGAVYFDNFEKWCEVVKERNLTICDEGDYVYSALDEEGPCGNFVVNEGEGCLFDNAISMEKAFDESVYTKVKQEAESLL
jgi:hypothetical protein